MPSPTQSYIQTPSSIPAAYQPAPCPAGSASTAHLHPRPFDEPRVVLFPLSA